jgi:hypothetical protein
MISAIDLKNDLLFKTMRLQLTKEGYFWVYNPLFAFQLLWIVPDLPNILKQTNEWKSTCISVSNLNIDELSLIVVLSCAKH